MTAAAGVLLEKKDGVARVTLNRPEVRNAFDDALISELKKIFGEYLFLKYQWSTRLLILLAHSCPLS